jgi:hypothetical protein
MYRSWHVFVSGKRIATMVGNPKGRDEALAFARFHWLQAEVEPNKLSRVAG